MKDNELIHFHDYFVFILDFFFIFNHKSSIILQENLFNSKRIKMFKDHVILYIYFFFSRKSY